MATMMQTRAPKNSSRNEISEFRGQYEWLSSFARIPVRIRHAGSGVTILYPTREHAFQAAKTLDMEERKRIAALPTAPEAKRAGQQFALRTDWDEIRFEVMRSIIRAQLKQHADLRAKLLATGDAELIEGNRWGDTVWGVDVHTGEGSNLLGIAWMAERDALRASSETTAAATAEASTSEAPPAVPAKTVSDRPGTCAVHRTPLLLESGSGGKFSCPRCF